MDETGHIVRFCPASKEKATGMPSKEYTRICDLAADQFGYVTTSQVRERGGSTDALRKMAKRGTLERISRGVYRLPTYPSSIFAEYMEASLWPVSVRGVISHQSSLALRGLSDVSPSAIHITVPANHRIRRQIPRHIVVHHAKLSDTDITHYEGIPTTILRRTIEDCHRAHLGPDLLRQAITAAQKEGFLDPGDAADLINRVLPEAIQQPGNE